MGGVFILRKRFVHPWILGGLSLLLFSSVPAWTQSSLKLKPSKENSLKVPLKQVFKSSGKQFDNSFEYRFRTYQSSGKRFFRESADSRQSEWTIGLRSHPGASGGGFDLLNTYQDVEQVNYFKPAEIYYKFQPTENSRLFLGRKLMPWSRSDRLWKRGLFESRFMDEPLDGRPAGLTGLFLTSPRPGEKGWLLFASPLFIPELGPRVSVQEGKLTSSNPWFRPPSERIRLDGNDINMRYSIERPSTEDIILQTSLGMSYRWSSDESPWGVRAGYVWKPMNQFLMSVPFVLGLTDVADDIEVEARIQPSVQYHHLTSIMLERKIAPLWSLWADWSYERPELKGVSRKAISQTTSPAHIYTVTLERRPQEVKTRFATQYWLSVSGLVGGDTDDRGEFATTGESLFERRYQFQESAQLGLKTYLGRSLGWPAQWKLSAIYDHQQSGGIVSTQVDIFSSQNFHWNISADWIGKVKETSKVDDGFTGQYRANDRYSMGVRYVF